MRVLQFLFLCLLLGCSPSCIEDFQKEGKAICLEIQKKIGSIETRDELNQATPFLKKKFCQLVDLMIEARLFLLRHPDAEFLAIPDPLFNEEFQAELMRVYRIEGGREILEKTQKEALIRFDAFKRKLEKKKSMK